MLSKNVSLLGLELFIILWRFIITSSKCIGILIGLIGLSGSGGIALSFAFTSGSAG
jgi:hypothetical protein